MITLNHFAVELTREEIQEYLVLYDMYKIRSQPPLAEAEVKLDNQVQSSLMRDHFTC